VPASGRAASRGGAGGAPARDQRAAGTGGGTARTGGHGWFRRVPDRIDRTVTVSVPGACPYCGCTELLSDHFPGTLVSDDYAGYHAVNPTSRQACVSHLVTRAKKLVEELQHGASQYLRQHASDFCTSVMALLSAACAADKRLVAPSARRRAAKNFTRDLRRLCTLPAAIARVDTFRQRILIDLPHLFTFLTTPNVPPTNNFAEQSIRHIVIFRKTSFGTRSAQGSKTLATLASLVLSVKLQNGNPLAFLRDLLVGNFDAAYRAVFPDTS